MLNYLITVTDSLLLPAIILGLTYARTSAEYGERGIKFLNIGALAGALCAAVMSYLKNTTSLIATGMWNVRIFSLALIALALLLISHIPAVSARLGKRRENVSCALLAIFVFTEVFYALPDIYAYPFNFPLAGASIFSSAFLTRFCGWLIALVLAFVTGLAVEKVGIKSERKLLTGVFAAVLAVNAALQSYKILQVLYTRRFIRGHSIFVFIKWAANHSLIFTFAAAAICLILPVVLWVRSFHVNEPYQNPAQKRKIKAKWRNIRRWGVCVAVCFALSAVTLTAVSAYANKTVDLSPIEESELRGENVYVALTQVEDGHLHRFAYTTPDNITVRFIVIKKPNSSSYGVGLDACDICGETGYYERGGQIVCKLCDVVMNINTIGFKGGCNPIVIDYSVEGGYIIVPTYTLIEHQNEFK